MQDSIKRTLKHDIRRALFIKPQIQAFTLNVPVLRHKQGYNTNCTAGGKVVARPVSSLVIKSLYTIIVE